MLTVKTNLDEIQKRIQKVHKKTRFAESEALNQTAKLAAKEQREEAQKKFDRPTPYLLNGIFKSSTKLGFVGVFSKYTTLRAELIPGGPRGRFNEGGRRINNVLFYQTEGGIRTPQRRALLVPTKKARLNRHGNMSKNYIKGLLARGDHVSLGRAQGLPPGIYKKNKNRSITLVVAYESQTRYRPTMGYYEIAAKTMRARFQKNFDKAFEAEMQNLR